MRAVRPVIESPYRTEPLTVRAITPSCQGESGEAGFTPFELDVTDEAKSGDNLLALRVTEHTRSSSLDNMSLYADFELSGIFRAVSIFAVSPAHIERLQVATRFDANYRNATLRIDLKLVNENHRRVSHGELR